MSCIFQVCRQSEQSFCVFTHARGCAVCVCVCVCTQVWSWHVQNLPAASMREVRGRADAAAGPKAIAVCWGTFPGGWPFPLKPSAEWMRPPRRRATCFGAGLLTSTLVTQLVFGQVSGHRGQGHTELSVTGLCPSGTSVSLLLVSSVKSIRVHLHDTGGPAGRQRADRAFAHPIPPPPL